MWIFGKCRHPARRLAVQKDPTEKGSKDFPEDYTHVTIHLVCLDCREAVDLTYAKPIGGVPGLMERAERRCAQEKRA